MKTLIAASIILASGIAQAQSFDYEKAVGSSELYSTLGTDQVVSVDTGHSGGFAYQESTGCCSCPCTRVSSAVIVVFPVVAGSRS